jgi:hypothetical protein
MERPWVTVAAFSGGKQSDKFNYPYRNSLFQTAAARRARSPQMGPLLLCRQHPIISLVTRFSARLCGLRSSLRIGAAHSDRHPSLVPAGLRFQLQLFAF